MNKEFFVVGIQKIIQSIVGFISIIVIAKFMSPGDQGLYFSFASILSSYTLIDLGLSGLLIQLSSKYYFSKNNSLFTSLYLASRKWFNNLALISLILIPIGLIYFKNNIDIFEKNIITPWFLNVCFLSLSICMLPIISIIEGMNYVVEVYILKILFYTSGAIFGWYLIINDMSLYAPGAIYFATFLFVFIYFQIFKDKHFKFTILNNNFSWKNEIFPLQSKVIYSCIAKYLFIFSPTLFIFYFFSPVEAGQAGMSSVVLNMICTITYSSLTSKTPHITKLYSLGNIDQSDKIFRHELVKTMMFTLVSIGIFLIVYKLYENFFLFKRMLDLKIILPLSLSFIIVQLMTAINVYFRIRGREALAKSFLYIMLFVYLMSIFLLEFFNLELYTFYWFMFFSLLILNLIKIKTYLKIFI
jgi:O-antigen/teichoic acid export membrane protein